MKAGSLFSGIGAPELAWRPLGWDFRWCAEIAAFPSAVLRHRYPEVPNLGNVMKVHWDAVEAIDLLVGGPPCQDFSIAGKRAGLDGARGNMAVEFFRIAGRLKPRWVVFENVPGLLSMDRGLAFGTLLGLLGQCGYGFAYRVLDARYSGIPQRRRRVFVIGYLGDWRPAAAVLFEREGLRGDPPPRRETGEGVAPTVIKGAPIGRKPEAGPQFGEWLEDGSCYTLNCTEQHAIAHTLNAHPSRIDGESETFVTHSLDAAGHATEDGTGRGVPLCVHALQDPISEAGLSLPLGAKDTGHAISFSSKDRGADAGSIAGSLRTKPPGSIENSSTTVAPQHSAVRRLTPRECERLMGFPDDYTLVPWRGGMAPDGPRYKALGNSMCVPDLVWLGERIALCDRLESAV
jgi:DNA (cytosine-5)-methyltransferase 1